MAQTTDYQTAFAGKVRVAAQAIRKAEQLARDVKREWEARGVDTAARRTWFETWAATADVPFTLEEFYAGAGAVLDLIAFVDGGAVVAEDRGAELVKVRQD
jgi:hypothetical protein